MSAEELSAKLLNGRVAITLEDYLVWAVDDQHPAEFAALIYQVGLVLVTTY